MQVVAGADALGAPAVDHIARVLLRRYGVVFRKLLERESGLPPWRELFYVYRRMEARGEIRGGRFVSGFAGEQFALPEAADLLQAVARDPTVDRVSISAADPLNLIGIVTPGERCRRSPAIACCSSRACRSRCRPAAKCASSRRCPSTRSGKSATC